MVRNGMVSHVGSHRYPFTLVHTWDHTDTRSHWFTQSRDHTDTRSHRRGITQIPVHTEVEIVVVVEIVEGNLSAGNHKPKTG